MMLVSLFAAAVIINALHVVEIKIIAIHVLEIE
jgi:hypothetical protein